MRYGGDEMFALLLGECDVDEIMNHIQELLRVFNTIAGYAYEVNVSCGAYSSVLSDDLSFDDMVKGADQQMYMVKKEKKRRNVN
jgi:diguanylate cyclase (GGDEF)-like protein